MLERIAGTPTGKLLETAGAGILGDTDAWEAARREDSETRNADEAAQRQAAREDAEAWLREQLKDGPVARVAIIDAAEAAGIPVRSTATARGASVQDARSRLGVLPLLRVNDDAKEPWWGLPGVPFSEALFTVYDPEIDRGGRLMSAHMR